MTVLTHLGSLSGLSSLSAGELQSVKTSLDTLAARLNQHFGADIIAQYPFGSSTRGTMLPRWMDDQSDVDYMIVFGDNRYNPQTYLDWLKRFADARYYSSEFKQSSPTVILELNHIKFDLVPTVLNGNVTFIPDKFGGWMITDPHGFSGHLARMDQLHRSLLKPAIRILKYWNASRGRVFESFDFEQRLARQTYFQQNSLQDYVLQGFEQLYPQIEQVQWRRLEMERAKEIVANVRAYEARGYWAAAETEIKKLLPPRI